MSFPEGKLSKVSSLTAAEASGRLSFLPVGRDGAIENSDVWEACMQKEARSTESLAFHENRAGRLGPHELPLANTAPSGLVLVTDCYV